jgi:hypothetical protein
VIEVEAVEPACADEMEDACVENDVVDVVDHMVMLDAEVKNETVSAVVAAVAVVVVVTVAAAAAEQCAYAEQAGRLEIPFS